MRNSATVSQTLTFSISDNAIAFGTLSTSAARYATNTTGSNTDVVAHTLAVATNGSTGYTITVQGPTLTSLQHVGDTITPLASATASSPGSSQFGIYATKAGTGAASGAVTAPYATASSFAYTGTSAPAQIASASTTSATETYSLHYLANISPVTPAGTYTTNLVYISTANF